MRKRTAHRFSWKLLSALALILILNPALGVAHRARAGAALLSLGQQSRPLSGHVPDIVAQGKAQLLGHHAGQALLQLAIALPVRDQQTLDQFLRDVTDPASPNYHHFLSQAAANQLFNPTATQEQQVVQWLQANGLSVTHTYPNHLLVDAQGTVSQVEQMLQVSINDYRGTVHGKDVTFYAPATDPVVAASVAGLVVGITGLDSVPRFHTGTNGSAHGQPGYYPQDFANAYDVNPLWNAGYTGTGQHIGITLWTVPPSDATLQSFASTTGAGVATTANHKLNVIQVDGGTTTADQGEAGMDIESSGGLAPNAVIDYYEAPTDTAGNPTDQGLEDALNLAGTDSNNNQQITNSWGGCEASSTTDPFTAATNTIYASNTATGHNYFFSSGDSGSTCGSTNPSPDYPASSPYVTSVGGTSFSANVGSAWPGETAWKYCGSAFACLLQGYANSPVGSGGGYSNIFSRPSWQTGSGLAANGKRGYPDIAADADPNTGAYVCYGAASTCGAIGGTSLSSPLWAGILADINQYLAATGKQPAGFIDPTLYSLANASQPHAAYHDITSGTNGTYNAAPGWDAVTGWGSLDAWNLAQDIAAGTSAGATGTPTNTPSATATPTSTATSTPAAATNTPSVTNTPSATATSTPTSVPASATNTPTATNTRTATATSTPTSTPAPDFSLSASPTTRSVPGAGGTTTYTISITPQNGFQGPVTLSASGQPQTSTASFSPTQATSTSTLTVTVASGTPRGSYTISITGQGATGTPSHTINVTLSVTKH